jgi:hypothetical protein
MVGAGTPAVRMAENGDVEEKKDLNILLGHEGRITGLACCSDQVRAALHVGASQQQHSHFEGAPLYCP